MATLSLSLKARLYGCQPLEISKSLSRGSCNLVFPKHASLVLHKDAPPRQCLQVVAHAMAAIVPETKKTRSPGEPLSSVEKKQLKWEKMMKEIDVSGSAVEVQSRRQEDGKVSNNDILGTYDSSANGLVFLRFRFGLSSRIGGISVFRILTLKLPLMGS